MVNFVALAGKLCRVLGHIRAAWDKMTIRITPCTRSLAVA